MNPPTLLDQILALSVEERFHLVQLIQDSIMDEVVPLDSSLELTAEQKSVLDRRRADLDASPDNVLTWDQIKAHVHRKT
jgi:putative addiction module component (TIGR02574 family)